ncbi:MAG: uncharacterized protein A8A55_1758 [Amphiamblys sp. WSBS2006]|nr:MAG: uncharacterized protein A8A55_1758 [Amphiamblys sp. WSBS2006]
MLKTENKSVWIGKVKRLGLEGYAIEILPKLGIHEENETEELKLIASHPENIAEIEKTENKSIWVGKVKTLRLEEHTVKIFTKLRFHGETEMEELSLLAHDAEYIAEILKAESRSIWIGKVKALRLEGYAVKTLTKLRIHRENKMDSLGL